MLHRVLFIRLGLEWVSVLLPHDRAAHLVHLKPEVEEEQGWDAAEAKRDSPDSIEVVHAKDPQADKADEVRDDKGQVDHGVGCCDRVRRGGGSGRDSTHRERRVVAVTSC